MSLRTIGLTLTLGLAPCAAQPTASASPSSASPSSASRPNILYILVDDLGWKDVGFHGSEIRTPNIDRLAKTGTRLDAFYVQPVCSPTRAALMTGRYPIRLGLQVGVIRPHAKYGLALDELLLPQALQRAGYTTAICGKWHLGTLTPDYLPTRRGFDHQYGHYLGAIDYFSKRRNGSVDWNRDDKPLDEDGYTTELIAKESVRLIDAHDKAKPLFLYVAFNAPHTPLQAPQRYLEQYAKIEKPNRRKFAAMVACVDDGIGKIVAALDERNMRENTLVIFTSDNGGARASDKGPFRSGKGSIYEGGTRTPAVVNWPGKVRAGAIVAEPLHIVDMMPTLVALAGGTTKGSKPLDGKDAWATITTGAKSPHEDILLNANEKSGAVRAGDWKIVHHRPRGNRPRAPKGFQLYNLKSDPGERQDLAAANPEKLAEMKRRLAKYRKGAVTPLGGSGPMPKGTSPKRWGRADKQGR